MIFTEKVTLKIGGSAPRTVRAIVTFIDSTTVPTTLGGMLMSRLRVVLSPNTEAVPPGETVTLSWQGFTDMTVEGAVEPHYRRGRLHHYECIARYGYGPG